MQCLIQLCLEFWKYDSLTFSCKWNLRAYCVIPAGNYTATHIALTKEWSTYVGESHPLWPRGACSAGRTFMEVWGRKVTLPSQPDQLKQTFWSMGWQMSHPDWSYILVILQNLTKVNAFHWPLHCLKTVPIDNKNCLSEEKANAVRMELIHYFSINIMFFIVQIVKAVVWQLFSWLGQTTVWFKSQYKYKTYSNYKKVRLFKKLNNYI